MNRYKSKRKGPGANLEKINTWLDLSFFLFILELEVLGNKNELIVSGLTLSELMVFLLFRYAGVNTLHKNASTFCNSSIFL